VKRLWSAKIGASAEFLLVALQPASDGNRLYAASRNGNVVALDPDTGKAAWRTELDMDLSSGPGVGDGLIVVGAADGMLIALDADSGAELWRANVTGETLARPIIKDGVVITMSIDNRLHAVSAFDGAERWTVEQPTPNLTMRGSASPVLVGTSVLAGFDNGRLVAVNIATGNTEWEAMLSPPTGRSDLERLSDVDGVISVVGQDIYASGYQGSLVALASESGQVLWAREVSSFEGVSADWNNLYTVDEEGVVIALTRRTGDESWRQNSLVRREPTVPIPFQTTVVVGDLEGYLHFFSNFDGDPVARVRAGSKAISIEPVVVADRLIVQGDDGSVSAYVIRQPKRPDNAPDISDDDA
jgi:outer membrane protein assembly factor BamB